jgi:ribulose-phosphate 3-epimerase
LLQNRKKANVNGKLLNFFLMKTNPIILAPSILAGDHVNLAKEAQLVSLQKLPWIHVDIMDAHFVPNLTFGPQMVADLRKHSDLFFDVHLMLERPDQYIEKFAKSGANLISIHVEPKYPQAETLQKIRQLGCQNGIALNPKTPAQSIIPFLKDIDLVLLMTVEPGFGGQLFHENVLPKIATIDRWRKEQSLDFRLEVDGGINAESAKQCYEQGADTLVAGTAFFQAQDKNRFIQSILSLNHI